ncbi:hypothetical protein [Hymenobacter cellulosilyticus]|uniref:Uncharacterized protein n=1 Tax=Hymenobacter cellulosilyticus TaxID=2932248 RepID=A0A8T9QFI5_9BACT|nr:hypothetical protein [Hymenobacter cellulosilyticus]UOQ74580.1 hypothetical protein MUN79_12320 [Hymenobacter cellulosilyticus]
MQNTLPPAFLLSLLLCGACQSSDSKTVPQEPAAATTEVPPPPPSEVKLRVDNPQVGDVLVVQFQPQDTQEQRYFFYHLYRLTPDSAYLHPARKEATDPAADLSQPDFQASSTSIAYTRDELSDLLKPQTGDVLKTQVVQVRRPE